MVYFFTLYVNPRPSNCGPQATTHNHHAALHKTHSVISPNYRPHPHLVMRTMTAARTSTLRWRQGRASTSTCCRCHRLTGGGGPRSEVGSNTGRRRGDRGIAMPWACPPTWCARAGAALAASDREGIITACRSMTAPWAIERAERARQQWGGRGGVAGGGRRTGAIRRGHRRWWGWVLPLYYDRFHEIGEGASMPAGVFDLDKIKKWGKSRNWCLYHLIRRAINRQSVVGRDDDSMAHGGGCKW